MLDVEFFGKLLEYGITSAILAWGWWRAEQRADRAQLKADSRAETMATMMAHQVETNERITAAMGLQQQILSRISVFIDRYTG